MKRVATHHQDLHGSGSLERGAISAREDGVTVPFGAPRRPPGCKHSRHRPSLHGHLPCRLHQGDYDQVTRFNVRPGWPRRCEVSQEGRVPSALHLVDLDWRPEEGVAGQFDAIDWAITTPTGHPGCAAWAAACARPKAGEALAELRPRIGFILGTVAISGSPAWCGTWRPSTRAGFRGRESTPGTAR